MKEQSVTSHSALEIERTYNTPLERVWKAITDKEEMKRWYFDMSDFKANVGFKFQFKGGDECKIFIHHCQVMEVIPQKKLSYTWCYEGYEGESLLTFELFEDGNKTRLKLTHEGLHTFPKNNEGFAKESFAAGWTMIMGTSLKDFLEQI